ATTGAPIVTAAARLAIAAAPQSRGPPVRIVCHDQTASATISNVAARRATSSLSSLAPSTHARQIPVAYDGLASSCRRRRIHAPGFGGFELHAGTYTSAKYG